MKILHVSEGLGDNIAQFSIPELIVRKYNEEVYIRESNWRNPDIKKLWEKKHFISGFTHEAPNFLPTLEITSQFLKYDNLIKAIESSYGFTPVNLYPKLYNIDYTFIKELYNKTLIDPKSIAVKYSKQNFEGFINRLKEQSVISLDSCLLLKQTYRVHEGDVSLIDEDLLPEIPRLEINSIWEYINVIFSCENFVCCASGSAAIASAIKNDNKFPKIYSLITTSQSNQKIWLWPGVNHYTINEKNYGDWRLF